MFSSAPYSSISGKIFVLVVIIVSPSRIVASVFRRLKHPHFPSPSSTHSQQHLLDRAASARTVLHELALDRRGGRSNDSGDILAMLLDNLHSDATNWMRSGLAGAESGGLVDTSLHVSARSIRDSLGTCDRR